MRQRTVLDNDTNGRGTADERESVLTRAILHAAIDAHLSDGELARILNVGDEHVQRFRSGAEVLKDGTASFRSAAMFIRLMRGLFGILGDTEPAASWLRSQNLDLGSRPIEKIFQPDGLDFVVSYVDSFRAKV